MAAPLLVNYDQQSDILTIDGFNYSGDLFRTLTSIYPLPSDPFKIVQRKDGVITLERYEGHHAKS